MTRARDIADLAGGGTLLTRQLFTATAGQTTFTPSAGYNPGALEVFMNGLMLLASDYTATNSSTVVLGVAANAGDEVEILTYQINTIGDTVSASNGGTFTSDVTVNGTVAATAYTGDGSGLTGVGSPSIDDNGNATAITITNDEKVGVGTTNPIALLSVVDSTTGSGMEFQPEIATNTNRLTNYNRTASAYKNFRLDALQLEFQTSGNERMKIDASGRVTMPSQPAFYVGKGTSQSPIGPTINTEYTLTYTSEKYDVGNNFANSTFTAPVTGKYLFHAQAMVNFAETGGNYYWLRINASNRSFGSIQSIKYSSIPTYQTFITRGIVDMDAGDTATVGMRYGSVVGSNPDVNVDDTWTWFSGYLLG